ncbi:MAG: GGDEF domain-containing protein [Bradymonadales bacterium]|nr:GGDEF domain-containing protein [Bradymonadales bacterium]
MVAFSPDQFHIALAGEGGKAADQVEALLAEAGYRCTRMALDLEGLRQVAQIKPSAILLFDCSAEQENWLLNLVEGNPNAPVVLALCDTSKLLSAPEWLYDVVPPTEIGSALLHRLNRALIFSDMRALTAEQTEKLGLSRAQIGMLSMIDVVTGLFNRRYFNKHLAESFAASTRYGRPLTVMLVRVDNQSELVANLGQELANDVLDTLANTMASIIRRADTAARIDEDLFGFLLPETPRQGASLLVKRLIGRLERTAFPYDAEVVVSTSAVEVSPSHQQPGAVLEEALASLPEQPAAAQD